MTNAQTIEVSTRQIDYAQCAPAPRLARDHRIAWCPVCGRIFVFQESQWQGIEEILNDI